METIKFDDIKQFLSNFDVYNLKNEKLEISEKSRIFYKNYTQDLIELTPNIEKSLGNKMKESSLSASESNEQERKRGFRR